MLRKIQNHLTLFQLWRIFLFLDHRNLSWCKLGSGVGEKALQEKRLSDKRTEMKPMDTQQKMSWQQKYQTWAPQRSPYASRYLPYS